MTAQNKYAVKNTRTNDPVEEFERICEMLRTLLLGEYERGSKDTAQRIVGLVGANANKINGTKSLARAPRGAAKVFVERSLQEGPGNISEIRARAQTPVEKALSYQTVRLELLRGLKDKRYKKNKDRFSLIG